MRLAPAVLLLAGYLVNSVLAAGSSAADSAGERWVDNRFAPCDRQSSLSRDEFEFSRALARFSYGTILLSSNSSAPEAWAEFRSAAELDPGCVYLAISTAEMYSASNRFDEAVALLSSTARENPRDLRIHVALGMTYQDSGNHKGALKEFRTVTRLAQVDHLGYIGMAEAYRGMKRDRSAFRIIRTGLERTRNSRNIRVVCDYLSIHYLYHKNYGLAADYLELIRADDFSDPASAMRLLECYLLAGKQSEAARLIGVAPSVLQTNAFFHYELGIVFSAAGDGINAINHFAESKRMASGAVDISTNILADASFYFHYGAALDSAGRYDEAETLFRKSIELNHYHHEAQNYLAYMWAELGVNLDDALTLAKSALSREPDNAAYVDTLGWIYFKQQRYAESLEQLRKACSLFPDDPIITGHLGDVLAMTLNHEEALEFWKKSYQLDPTDQNVIHKLTINGVSLRKLRSEHTYSRRSDENSVSK